MLVPWVIVLTGCDFYPVPFVVTGTSLSEPHTSVFIGAELYLGPSFLIFILYHSLPLHIFLFDHYFEERGTKVQRQMSQASAREGYSPIYSQTELMSNGKLAFLMVML